MKFVAVSFRALHQGSTFSRDMEARRILPVAPSLWRHSLASLRASGRSLTFVRDDKREVGWQNRGDEWHIMQGNYILVLYYALLCSRMDYIHTISILLQTLPGRYFMPGLLTTWGDACMSTRGTCTVLTNLLRQNINASTYYSMRNMAGLWRP